MVNIHSFRNKVDTGKFDDIDNKSIVFLKGNALANMRIDSYDMQVGISAVLISFII